MEHGIVIVGGGQAGAAAAAKARELNADVSVTLICDEPVLPYQRPPLSKKYLSGEMPLERLILRPQSWFDDHNVTVLTGARVEAIHRDEKNVMLFSGEEIAYDKLLLTTGSRVRQLPVAMGGELEGVHTLRTTAHSDDIRPAMKAGANLVVIGGGYIGLEVAAIAAQAGMNVTLVEMAERILQRVAAPETSNYYRILHEKHRVTLLEGTGLSHLVNHEGRVTGAELTDGTILPADIVLVGIGVMPASTLAELSGLAIENGVRVNEYCETSDPDIYASGDCVSFPYKGEQIRLESVPNAIAQSEVAVENMLGAHIAYQAKPWFWSDQYEVKLQIAGLNTGYDDTVVRMGKREGAQSVWYYKGEQLLAVDAMNDAPAFMMARRILEAGKSVPKEVASDLASNLKDWC